MNRIFKVIWSNVRGTYIVCDENRVSHGKTKAMKCAGMAVAVAAFLGISAAGDIANADPLPDRVIENQTFVDTNKTIGKTHPPAAIVTVTADDASSLTVRGSTFTNNTLTITEYAYKPASIGIASKNVDVTVIDSRFTNNVTNDDAWAIEGGQVIAGSGNASAIGVHQANLTVRGSDFTDNRTLSKTQAQGSAIYHSVGTVSISDSSFNNNTAANTKDGVGNNATGGAVSLWGSDGTIANSTFIGNRTTVENDTAGISYGGAIYARSGVWEGGNNLVLNVSNSTFKNNEAAGSALGLGGAIFVKSDPATVATPFLMALNVDRGLFEGNKAGFSGGAIYSVNAPLSIIDTTFRQNEAGNGGGGAIRFENNAQGVTASTITKAVFDSNTAGGQTGSGGAIYNNAATVNIDNAVFDNNKAVNRGGAIFNSANAALSFSGINTFTGNTTGTGGSVTNNDIHNEGVINILGGSTTLNGGMTGSGTVNVSGGTLATVAIGDGATINLSGTGVLKTTSDQVMNTGLNDAGTTPTTGWKQNFHKDGLSGWNAGIDGCEIQSRLCQIGRNDD